MDRTIQASWAEKSKKRIRFPIRAKLTLISTVLSLLFLPVIVALAARLTNARNVAQEHTRATNDWTARTVESELENVHSGAVSLLRKIDEADSAVADANGIAERFFTLNPSLKAVFTFSDILQTTGEASAVADSPKARDAPDPRLFVNNTAEPIGRETMTLWFESQKETLTLSDEILLRKATRAATRTAMEGAAPFSDDFLLVMIFPYKSGAEITRAAVFFSPENLVRSFGIGENASFLINEAGDVLFQTENGGDSDDLSFIQWQTLERGNRSFTSTYKDAEGAEGFAAIKKIAVHQRGNENNLVVITTIKTAFIFEKTAAVVRFMCCIGGGALVLSLLLVQVYSRIISKPLFALIHAADSIKDGDYAVNRANRSRDEIGELTQSFVSMTRGVAYFEQFANKTALRLARQGAPVHAGKTLATVCFVKFRAFAELTRKLSAWDTAALANEFFSCLTRRITHAGGVVDTFLTHDGAALVAFWGALESGAPERHAMNCIHAALTMRASLQKLNKERLLRVHAAQSEAPQPERTANAHCVPLIEMRCVVNTGESLTGIISADERKELLIAGDAASLAERVADANEDFDTDILIMERTWELIGERLVLEETPVIAVKGRERSLRTFALVNVQSGDEADAILQEAETPEEEPPRCGPADYVRE
ncbi:MAG: adenylate/guanylate cyclase domain-containing protein [Treponema sp.]|jgi:adenylate cyclase|nr:adenylate/guanylate cyclase domain-containing protein [Treponema sp.]